MADLVSYGNADRDIEQFIECSPAIERLALKGTVLEHFDRTHLRSNFRKTYKKGHGCLGELSSICLVVLDVVKILSWPENFSDNPILRLADPGGPLVTNKAESLAKFLERKLQEPGGLSSINPDLVELAVKNAKETLKASTICYDGPDGWKKLSGDDVGELHYKYCPVVPSSVEQEMAEVAAT